ncbi:MAG: CvpA family protein [Anaerolineae bacterium]|nr:CvpA family protein [Anaerolineae bacterium]
MGITLLDVLILLALVGGAAWGFYRGLFRQAATTLVIYISTVVSTLTYRGLSKLISGAAKPASATTDMLSFIIVMAVFNIALAIMVNDLLKDFEPKKLGMWVNLGGIVFGILNAVIWSAVLLIIVRYAVGGGQWIGYEGVQQALRRQLSTSVMATIFRPLMQVIIAAIRPWLFGRSLPPLLMTAF